MREPVPLPSPFENPQAMELARRALSMPQLGPVRELDAWAKDKLRAAIEQRDAATFKKLLLNVLWPLFPKVDDALFCALPFFEEVPPEPVGLDMARLVLDTRKGALDDMGAELSAAIEQAQNGDPSALRGREPIDFAALFDAMLGDCNPAAAEAPKSPPPLNTIIKNILDPD